jgi:Nif-specific regulatory protein
VSFGAIRLGHATPVPAFLIRQSENAANPVALDPASDNLLGRGLECTIVLTDPLCSRVHAIVGFQDGRWQVRDGGSRNGTFVNRQKIDDATLVDGNMIRVGSTEFLFHESTDSPTRGDEDDNGGSVTQTLIKDADVTVGDSSTLALAVIQESEQTQDLLLLYQLSIKLLGTAEPDTVIRTSLELVLEHTGASLAGFLWVDDEGHLRPKMVLPEQATSGVSLSDSLTTLVLDERKAVWIANQRSGADKEDLQHYADALCVPLQNEGKVVGAIHIYLEQGRFRQSHFDFAISLANITAVALVRARHEVSLQSDLQRLRDSSPGYDEMVGESPPMQALKTKIKRLARATGCALIRGESGTGKELVARALHQASPRNDRPLLSVNCAAIPDDLMESQLFGHKAGAFTGAERDHAGFFQQADLGTLFLDEVGEMTLQGQAKLLRILEGHPFLPVGGNEEISVDVRVIAATNQELQEYVREKKFREDLYYRLSVFELTLPPLRERGEDVGRLLDFFLDKFKTQHGRPHLKMADSARSHLMAYQWPGNIRQLRNVMDSAVVLADGAEITISDLGLRDTRGGELDSLRLDAWEKKLIIEALKRSGGNVAEAAKLLGIGRATLYRKIEEYDVPR